MADLFGQWRMVSGETVTEGDPAIPGTAALQQVQFYNPIILRQSPFHRLSIKHLTMYEAEDLSVEKNSGYSEALGHPVYILTYTTSELHSCGRLDKRSL
mgnify:CR=1 FL=1